MSDERLRAVIGTRLEGLVSDLVREVRGDEAIERRPRYPGDSYPQLTPVPLASVWATKQLAAQVDRQIVLHIRRAREAGHDWDEIGEALSLTSNRARTRAEAAFESVAWRGDPRSPQAYAWRCQSCDRFVSDRGPYNSHPEDNEVGHAENCQRMAADVEPRHVSHDREDEKPRPLPQHPRPGGGTQCESPGYEL